MPTIVVFLDIRTAYDSLDRTVLWNCLFERSVPEKFVNILKALYRNTSGRVRTYNQLSSLFPTNSGVRQGFPISPFLFNFAIDDILKSDLKDVREGGVDLLPGGRLPTSSMQTISSYCAIACRLPESHLISWRSLSVCMVCALRRLSAKYCYKIGRSLYLHSLLRVNRLKLLISLCIWVAV
uniref:Reverse transcriptase domain-containing protein n=1 Tax=Trichobilharzia regenti TaxID=157069 RepID=A0AA85JW58_TRIRE|nr:unnamed protein product [Trichobilharzia regenti]